MMAGVHCVMAVLPAAMGVRCEPVCQRKTARPFGVPGFIFAEMTDRTNASPDEFIF